MSYTYIWHFNCDNKWSDNRRLTFSRASPGINYYLLCIIWCDSIKLK